MALQSWTTDGSTGRNNWYWRQIVEDVGYDVTTNTSTVYVTAQIKGTYWYGTVYTSINCNGEVRNETHNYSSATYFSDWTTIQWASFTVSHNSDGTKTIGVSASLDAPGISPYNASASGNYSLTTIPRATPCPAVSGYIEDLCDFNLSPYAAFSHSINLSWKNKNYYLQSDGTLGTSEYKFGYSDTPIFDIDASYYQEFTDSDRMNATTTLRTYSGTTLIGTTTNTFTFICNPAKCNPSITSYEFYDNNDITVALTDNNLDIISGASNVIVNPTIKISSQYDTATTISRMIADGVEYSETPFDIGTLQKNYVDVTIYNSRNMYYQTSLQGKGRFIQYFPTTFNISKLARPEPTTGEVSIKYSGNIFNDYFDTNKQHKNTLTITWKYREKGTSEYTNGGTLSPTLKDNTYSGEESLGTIFDYQKQYEFIFTITDSIYTYDSTVQNVPRGYPIFYWTKDKVRILEDLYVKNKKIGDADFCQLTSNVELQDIAADTWKEVETWGTEINYGEYEANASRGELVIKNTELIQLSGKIAGLGYAVVEYLVNDSSGNSAIINSETGNPRALYQFGGNKYWSTSLPTMYLSLDVNKTYYIKLRISGYNETFSLNTGFGKYATWISALKIK